MTGKNDNQNRMKKLRAAAEELLAAGVNNKAQLEAAVPALVALQSAERAVSARINETRAVIEQLSAACSDYAREHLAHVFGDTFSVSPIGVESGDIEIDGRTYHFSRGFDGYIRMEPGMKMTQNFLANLPEDWTRSKLELDATAMKDQKVTVDELGEHGLVRKVRQGWSEINM